MRAAGECGGDTRAVLRFWPLSIRSTLRPSSIRQWPANLGDEGMTMRSREGLSGSGPRERETMAEQCKHPSGQIRSGTGTHWKKHDGEIVEVQCIACEKWWVSIDAAEQELQRRLQGGSEGFKPGPMQYPGGDPPGALRRRSFETEPGYGETAGDGGPEPF